MGLPLPVECVLQLYIKFMRQGRNMKILVTGANGYIGRHVVSEICSSFPDVEVLSLGLTDDVVHEGAHTICADILKRSEDENLYQDIGSPDAIIHLAWQDGFSHNAPSHINKVAAHYNFLKNMINHGCANLTVMGTVHEVGYHEGAVNENTACNPLSAYGVAKNALRQMISIYTDDKPDVSVKWLRAYYILGDDGRSQSVFSKILKFEEEGKEVFPFTDGLNKYDFIDLAELSKQIVSAALQTKVAGVINVCSGEPVSLKDKVEWFLQSRNLKIRPQYGMFPSRKYDSPAIWGDNTKIKKIMAGHFD